MGDSLFCFLTNFYSDFKGKDGQGVFPAHLCFLRPERASENPFIVCRQTVSCRLTGCQTPG